MAHEPRHHSSSEIWQKLVDAATRAAIERGYSPGRLPGRGRSNIWSMQIDGERRLVSIRTTRDRWFAFPRVRGGWKTLDKVDVVFVSAVDDKDDPKMAQVYMFPADEVRKRFNANFEARINGGRVVRENFGMWLGLDPDNRGLPASVGSGLATKYEPIATYALSELAVTGDNWSDDLAEDDNGEVHDERRTIADILADASAAIAKIAGVETSKVRLDLKIEHG